MIRRARLAAAVTVALVVACSGSRRAEPPMTSVQLEAAAAKLDRDCTEAPDRLPGYGSPTFARLTAADNRKAIVAAPLAARTADHARHTAAILRLYNTYLRCGRPVETLAVNAALLEGYAASMADGEALIASLPADAPETAQKRAGHARKIGGLQGGIGSTIGMLADPALGPPVPAALATRLGAAIGQVRAALPPGALDAPLAHLADAIAAESDPARKQILIAVRDAAR